MVDKVMYSSEKTDWETPEELFAELDAEFKFSLDVCASKENTKVVVYYDEETDALNPACRWDGVCWMNPPYGRGIGKWVEKAWRESCNNNVVVCLLPARTDTAWWHDYVEKYASDIRFIRGRLKFVGADNSAPFPSVIVVFSHSASLESILDEGHVTTLYDYFNTLTRKNVSSEEIEDVRKRLSSRDYNTLRVWESEFFSNDVVNCVRAMIDEVKEELKKDLKDMVGTTVTQLNENVSSSKVLVDE